jgi:serine/threonine protein kinase
LLGFSLPPSQLCQFPQSRGDAWCAVKLIPKKKPAAASFYEHEIQILKLLAHPQILPLIDAFECPDDYVVVTPFLSGGELFAKLRTIDHYDEQVNLSSILFSIFLFQFYWNSLFFPLVSDGF